MFKFSALFVLYIFSLSTVHLSIFYIFCFLRVDFLLSTFSVFYEYIFQFSTSVAFLHFLFSSHSLFQHFPISASFCFYILQCFWQVKPVVLSFSPLSEDFVGVKIACHIFVINFFCMTKENLSHKRKKKKTQLINALICCPSIFHSKIFGNIKKKIMPNIKKRKQILI